MLVSNKKRPASRLAMRVKQIAKGYRHGLRMNTLATTLVKQQRIQIEKWLTECTAEKGVFENINQACILSLSDQS